jgi:hypothetical protein
MTFGAAAFAGACGGATEGGGDPSDASPGDAPTTLYDVGNPPLPAQCPTSPPASGSACDIASDIQCSYGNPCAPEIASCEMGTWHYLIVNPPAQICPQTPPTEGTKCDTCGPSICQYGGCWDAGPNGPMGRQCVNGVWGLLAMSCNPPATFDAGAGD